MAIFKRHRAPRFRRTAPVAVSGLLALAGPAYAQHTPTSTAVEGLDVSGSMRLRYETVDGQVRPGFNPSDELIDLRTIVTATYKAGPFRIGGEVYDSRSWLANTRTPISTNEVNALDLVQAWVGADIEHFFYLAFGLCGDPYDRGAATADGLQHALPVESRQVAVFTIEEQPVVTAGSDNLGHLR